VTQEQAGTSWNDLEPSKGVYSWSILDGYLALAQKHNVDALYTFGQTAEWAASGSSSQCVYGPGSCFPPLNIQDWDDFVTAVVAHSAGKIKYWVIWNETNYTRFWMGNLPTLVTMAQHAYKIIQWSGISCKGFHPPVVKRRISILLVRMEQYS
jgi:hypothetical protein